MKIHVETFVLLHEPEFSNVVPLVVLLVVPASGFTLLNLVTLNLRCVCVLRDVPKTENIFLKYKIGSEKTTASFLCSVCNLLASQTKVIIFR
jgi:hypothetical protein